MSRRTAAVLLLCCLAAAPSAAKERYNVWAKERIRYQRERMQKDPYNPELRVLLAIAYFEDQSYFEAARQLEAALELKPGYAEAHCNLGIVRHAQSRVAEAEEHYRLALARDSTLVEAMAGLGTLLCASGQQGEGIGYLERTLRRDPDRDDARYNLGVAYYRVQDYRRSISHLERLLEREQGHAAARQALSQSCFARGLVLLQARQPQPALEFFTRSFALREDADVVYAQGVAHLRLEDLASAGKAFAAAVRLDSEHVPAIHNLAYVLDRTGRAEEAERYYQLEALLTPHLHRIESARNAAWDDSYLFDSSR